MISGIQKIIYICDIFFPNLECDLLFIKWFLFIYQCNLYLFDFSFSIESLIKEKYFSPI